MIGSFVCTGIGGGSTVALFITEGFGVNTTAPAPSAVLGGIPKRRRGRYEFEINGQRFIASSVPALEAMVARWRKANPANDTAPQPELRPTPPKEVVPHLPEQAARPYTATPPATARAPGAMRPPQLAPIPSELVAHLLHADIAARALAEAAAMARAQAEAEEEAEIEVLLAILLEAA